MATVPLGGPVLQWVKGSANESVLRPSATRMRATVFSTSKATVETFPAGSKWVLQRLAELASTGRAIDCVMKEVSKAAVAAALRVRPTRGPSRHAKTAHRPRNAVAASA
jgi:hypothetical protein